MNQLCRMELRVNTPICRGRASHWEMDKAVLEVFRVDLFLGHLNRGILRYLTPLFFQSHGLGMICKVLGPMFFALGGENDFQ